MLSEEQVDSFHREGYLNGGAALDYDVVDVLRD